MINVFLSLAVICFTSNNIYRCYPALVGNDTPKGEFPVVQLITQQPGYGGDVIEFLEKEDMWFAIHRVWTLKPSEHRVERLKSNNVKDRIGVTHGCINVMPEVYEKLRDCCIQEHLIIR